MKTFKQWHEDSVFFREQDLLFGRCDIQHRMSLSELLLSTSDSAVEDYHTRGISYDVLKENGYAILVSRVSFKIIKMPMANNIITIKTWEEAPSGLQLSRRYEITNPEGQQLVTASSLWILVNPETRRIIKPNQFTLLELPLESTDFSGIPCGKITLPENLQLLDQRTIRYTDLDANGHMNNSRYGAYIMDCLPSEFQSKTMTNFRINYSHEATMGDELQLLGCFDQKDKVVIIGKTNQGICFESELYY